MLFLVIPVLIGVVTVWVDDGPHPECFEHYSCEEDEVPETVTDKFNPRVVFGPKGEWD